MKISSFNYSILGYILPITSLPPNFYKRSSWPTHIFKSRIQTNNLPSIASHAGIFQTNLLLIIEDLCRSLQPCVISSTAFGEKLDYYCQPCKRIYKSTMDLIPYDWMIGNTYLKMTFFK